MAQIEGLLKGKEEVNKEDYFQKAWESVTAMKEKIASTLKIKRHASSDRFANYKGIVNEIYGSLNTYVGDGPDSPVDWMVHSYIANPVKGFTNIHLNVYLSPVIDVPHFTLVFGSFPDTFFFLDIIPRVDLHSNIDYLDKYYSNEPTQTFLEFQRDVNRFKQFVSHDPYMRSAVSPCCICVTSPCRDDECFDFLIEKANKRLDMWLNWVLQKLGSSKLTNEKDRCALALRDWKYRKQVVERDPANSLAEKLLGKELTRDLILAKWGSQHENEYVAKAIKEIDKNNEKEKDKEKEKEVERKTITTTTTTTVAFPQQQRYYYPNYPTSSYYFYNNNNNNNNSFPQQPNYYYYHK